MGGLGDHDSSILIGCPIDTSTRLDAKRSMRTADCMHACCGATSTGWRLILGEVERKVQMWATCEEEGGTRGLTKLCAVEQILSFDSKGRKALARHHNFLTGAMLDRAIRRDQRIMEKIEWDLETIEDDLALYTTQAIAVEAWKLLSELGVAGNPTQLKLTRNLMAYTDTTYDNHDHRLTLEKAKLDRKLYHIARTVQEMSHKTSGGGKLAKSLSRRSSEAVGASGHHEPSEVRSSANNSANSPDTYLDPRYRMSPMDREVEQIRTCLYRALRGKNASNEGNLRSQDFSHNLILPARPSIRSLVDFDADELESFFLQLKGDLAHKARFSKYAGQMRRLEMDGSCLQYFGERELAALDIPVGDREALLLGVRLVYRVFESSEKYMHQVEIKLLRASHLPAKDSNGLCDAYALVKLDHSGLHMRQEFTSTYLPHSLDPIWKNQYCRFRIPDLTDPGELIINVYDFDILTADDLVGSHIFGEALQDCNIPSLGFESRKVLWFSDILARVITNLKDVEYRMECKGDLSVIDFSHVAIKETLPLYRNGVAVIGKDGEVASIDVSFSLPQGGQSELQLPLLSREYPHSAGAGLKRVKLHVFMEHDAGEVSSEGRDGRAQEVAGNEKEDEVFDKVLYEKDQVFKPLSELLEQPHSPLRSTAALLPPPNVQPCPSPGFLSQESPDVNLGPGSVNLGIQEDGPKTTSSPLTALLDLQEDGAFREMSPTSLRKGQRGQHAGTTQDEKANGQVAPPPNPRRPAEAPTWKRAAASGTSAGADAPMVANLEPEQGGVCQKSSAVHAPRATGANLDIQEDGVNQEDSVAKAPRRKAKLNGGAVNKGGRVSVVPNAEEEEVQQMIKMSMLKRQSSKHLQAIDLRQHHEALRDDPRERHGDR